MPTRATPRASPPVPATRARTRATTRATTGGESAPRLPHERDQSSDSVDPEPTDVMRQAHEDVTGGMVDTDRGAPADAAYRKQKGAPKAKPAVQREAQAPRGKTKR